MCLRYVTEKEEWVFFFTYKPATFVKQLRELKGKMSWAWFTQAFGKRVCCLFWMEEGYSKNNRLRIPGF